MFSIFTAARSSNIKIARDGNDLLAKLSSLVAARQPALDALGDRHWEIDLELVGQIEAVLAPELGSSGIEEASRWFQSMDWHGDGIRHLEFQPGVFRTSCIPQLQGLLVGEYANFGILCWAPTADGLGGVMDGVAIFSDSLVLTSRLAGAWEHA